MIVFYHNLSFNCLHSFHYFSDLLIILIRHFFHEKPF
uniref:Uncharacterized protein n=1 Tax=Rhizophora mucronata TaxID=61149 RepID=A0A2P2N9Q5_RHIMU